MRRPFNILKVALRNPSFGLFPYIIFSILIGYINIYVALIIALGVSIIPILLKMGKESRVIYDISAWSLLITLICTYFLFSELSTHPQLAFVFSEIILVFTLMVYRILRKRIVKILRKGKHREQKFYIYESFHVSFLVQYALTFHLIIILGSRVYFTYSTPTINFVSHISVFQIILAIVIILETFRIRLLKRKLNKEEWWPVVSESGNVQGRIAKSISVSLKNKFLHPIIRVALIYDGKIYLKERSRNRLLEPGKLDYPFEKYMLYRHKLEEALKNVIKQEIDTDSLPTRFLLKYIFHNEETNRLIFLYAAKILTEKEYNALHLRGGKLWTLKQIEDNLGQNVFSECFELEFEYLKNTVLITDIWKRQSH